MGNDEYSVLRLQQRLDRTALVHCAVALCHLVEGQGQIEHLARIDLAVPHKVYKLGQEAPHRGRTAVQRQSETIALYVYLQPSIICGCKK